MTREETIELAKQAGFFVKDGEAYSPSVQEDHELTPYLKAFAALVADKERENCAKVCEQMNSIDDYYGERIELICAEAIRFSGETA
jgi:hypothetical protein